MSRENVEMVRRAFETFNRGGPEAVISEGLWSPELVWDFRRAAFPDLASIAATTRSDPSSRMTVPGVPVEEWEVELDELIDNGDRVIASARQRGRGATSGVGVELEQAHIFTLRDGKVVGAESYLDRKKALEAAELSE